MIGQMVVVVPDKTTIKNFFEKLRDMDTEEEKGKNVEDYIEKNVGSLDVVIGLAEEARYLQYKLNYQKPNGMEISIEIINYPPEYRVLAIPSKLVMLIDKMGEKIKFNYPFLDDPNLDEISKFVHSDWIYIDSKTSPDN